MQVYVFGLGHIGLTLADLIALNGIHVNGIDINSNIISSIQKGTINIEEYYNDIHISKLTKDLINSGVLSIGTELIRKDTNPSIFIITVGIINNSNGQQDISPLHCIINSIIPKLVANDLIIFRTTMIPGTCENEILPKLKALDFNVSVSYCPETLIETHAFEEFERNPIIIAADDEIGYEKTVNFIKCISKAPIYKASNMITAEMAKVVQNIHRDVDIALANEISDAALQLGVNFYELQRLVNSHPRVNLLNSGPGVGGYCLPNAYSYLNASITDKEKCKLTLISTARKLNTERPVKIVEMVIEALNKVGKDIMDSTIAVLGLSMKDYCADTRLSPALDIISLLLGKGAKIKAFDPIVTLKENYQVSSYSECIKNADCLLITAIQKGINFDISQLDMLMKHPIIIVDT